MGREILVFGGREERVQSIEGGSMLRLDVEGMCVDLATTILVCLQRTLGRQNVYLLYPSS